MKNFSILLLLLWSALSVAAPLQFDVSAGFTLDDNITRAETGSDIEKDTVLNIDAATALRLPLNDISYFTVGGSLSENHYLDFSKLTNTRLGVNASYHIRPSPGYTAIRYFAQLAYELRIYESGLRDGSSIQFGLGLSKRLTDLITLRAGYHKEKINADHVVFDANNRTLYLDAEYKLNASNNVYLTLSNFDGDIVATAVPTAKIIQYASAIVRDDAFLDLTPDRFAYKLSAKTNTIRLGDNFAIDSRQSLDGSVIFYNASAYGGNDYSGTIFNLNYGMRF
jgi:hypothetical protein